MQGQIRTYLRTTLIYVIFGIVWIFTTDQILLAIVDDPLALTFYQMVKGWLFIFLSAALIFYLSWHAWKQQIRAEEERIRLFKKTLESSHHILLNYLNQMQILIIEAESCGGFDENVIRIAKDVSRKAKLELMKLEELESVTPETIHDTVYRRSEK